MLELINSRTRKSHLDLCIENPEECAAFLAADPSDEEILQSEWAEALLELNAQIREQRRRARALRERDLATAKAANRATYLPAARLRAFPQQARQGDLMTKLRWRYDATVECAGLLPRISEAIYGSPSRPMAMAILNETNEPSLPEEEFEFLRRADYIVSGGRVAWDLRNPATGMLFEAFPSALDFRAYNHSLRAPLVPQGFVENPRVVIRTVTTRSYASEEEIWDKARKLVIEKRNDPTCALQLLMGRTSTLGEALDLTEDKTDRRYLIQLYKLVKQDCQETIPAGVDGSGAYHPGHPDLANLVAEHGAVTMQFRMMLRSPEGTWVMAKGLLVPRMDAVDEFGQPAIQLDPLQIKGAGKPWAKTLVWNGEGKRPYHEVEASYLGVMAARNKPSTMDGGFEVLENIELNPETYDVVRERTGQAMERLGKGGLKALIQSEAQKDLAMANFLQLMLAAEAHGVPFDPMSVPMVAQQIKSSLKRRLWPVAQGAGFRGKQAYLILDEGVPEGKCVTSLFKPGTKIAGWRFPIVLEQGLLELEVMRPLRHHKIPDGEKKRTVPYTVWMNPKDGMSRIQGDDDGDIVALTDDPEIVDLFSFRNGSGRVFQIESEGEKFDLPMAEVVEEIWNEETQSWVAA